MDPDNFRTEAWAYCRNLETMSARTSSQWAGTGIFFGAVGIPAAAAGTVLTVAEAGRDDPNTEDLAVNMSIAAGGYLASILAAFAFERSAAGAAASAEAGKAMKNLTDKDKVFDDCIDARATWISSRHKAIEAAQAEAKYWKKKYEREEEEDEGTTGDAGGQAGGAPATGGAPAARPVGVGGLGDMGTSR